MLLRIENLHGKNLLHRDLKPDNFLVGIHEHQKGLLYLIDLGLAKSYIDPLSKEHISYKGFKSLIGTLRYASVNTHLGFEQSRRDDLESIGYLLVYFMKGRLPWQGLAGRT